MVGSQVASSSRSAPLPAIDASPKTGRPSRAYLLSTRDLRRVGRFWLGSGSARLKRAHIPRPEARNDGGYVVDAAGFEGLPDEIVRSDAL